MSPVELMAWRMAFARPGIHGPVRRINQPHSEQQQDRRQPIHRHLKAPSKKNLPQHCDHGRIQAQQVGPQPQSRRPASR